MNENELGIPAQPVGGGLTYGKHHEKWSDIKKRLYSSGLLEDAVRELREFQDIGATKEEAREQVARKYPPRPLLEKPPGHWLDPKGESQLVDGRVFAGKESTLQEDFEWAFHNLGRSGVLPEDAPSCGAWFTYNWVRESMTNKSQFMMAIMKMLPSQVGGKPKELSKSDEPKRLTDDKLEKMIIKFQQKHEAG